MKRIRLDPMLSVAGVGLLLLAVGVGLVYLPAAFAVVGVALVAYAVFLFPDKPGGPTQ